MRLFMKHKVIDLVYTYEDSDYEIQTMQLSRLYVMKRKQQIATHFKDIKMYNLCFNYCGYGLSVVAGQTPQACVPSYLLAKYNNKDETNPRKKIARLTMNKLLNELSTSSIDEGCSCPHVIRFCNLHKIVYYILDFRYKLFESNNHMNTGQTCHGLSSCARTDTCIPSKITINGRTYSEHFRLWAAG